MFEIFVVFHLAVIIFCGLIASRSDILSGKIRNKDLFFCFLIGIFSHVLLILSAGQEWFLEFGEFVYLENFAVNLVVSVFVSYAIWHLGLWTAGDAKLFIVFSFLIPLNFYSKGYLGFFPSSAFLLNVFLPVFVFILFLSLVNFFKWANDKEKDHKFLMALAKNKFSGFAQMTQIREYAANFAFMFVLLQVAFPKIAAVSPAFFQNNLFIFAFLFVINGFTKNIFKNGPSSYLFLFVSSLILAADFVFGGLTPQNASLSLLKMAAFMALFVLADKMVDFYLSVFEVKNVKPEEITAKMVLSEQSFKSVFEKIGEKLSGVRAEGLSEHQAALVRDWAREEKNGVEIYRTMPFAPWIFAGVLLTLILKQSVLHFVLSVIK